MNGNRIKGKHPALAALPILLLVMGFLAASGASVALAVDPPGISPASVEATIADGASLEVAKRVQTPAIPPNPDIVFLADTTGSMGGAIANVKANAISVMNQVLLAQPTAQFAVAQYKDVGDVFVYNLDQAMTANTVAVQAAINTWGASGGGDFPEADFYALDQVATGATGFRPPPSSRIIAWFGDAPSHDPVLGVTQASAIASLNAASVRVIAIQIGGDATLAAQMAAVAAGTGGTVSPATANDVATAILAGLSNLPITVSMVSDCTTVTGGVVTTTFSPASVGPVVSGSVVNFTETISVSATPAQQGQTYECDDYVLIDGTRMTDAAGVVIKEHKTIRVPDTTAPTARCIETTNPAGNNVPKAGPNAGNSGQNPDGFYELLARDNVDPNPRIFVVDKGTDGIFGTADDTTFGPFVSGTKIKYTEANGATPGQKPGSGDVDWKINGRGDFGVYAVDATGNVGTHIQCHVAPPPKQ